MPSKRPRTVSTPRSHAAKKKTDFSADQRAKIDTALRSYGAHLTDDDRIAKGGKVLSLQLEAKGGRLKMFSGGNVLASYPVSRAGQGISDFVEKFWFWKKEAPASAHATKKIKKSPKQLQREIDEKLAEKSTVPRRRWNVDQEVDTRPPQKTPKGLSGTLDGSRITLANAESLVRARMPAATVVLVPDAWESQYPPFNQTKKSYWIQREGAESPIIGFGATPQAAWKDAAEQLSRQWS